MLHHARLPPLHQPCRLLLDRCHETSQPAYLHSACWDAVNLCSSMVCLQVRGGKPLAAVSTPTSCGLMAPLLEPDTPNSSLSEEHVWRIRVSQ